jgi:chorismate dehydratase
LVQKIKVGAVSYLNTKPLIYGFEQGMMAGEIELTIDYPSNIAQKLLTNEIDIGLVPVAILPKMKEYHILSGYCIGCEGPVASVCLFSDVPLDEIKTVLLDYQSRTSVALLKILLKEYWKLSPQFLSAEEGFEKNIKEKTAALVIGDRALALNKAFNYVYDLGEAWLNFTKLPFVFAAWIANKKYLPEFEDRFDKATGLGLNHLDDIIQQNKFTHFNLQNYYNSNISYLLNSGKKQGLDLFLKKMEQHQLHSA